MDGSSQQSMFAVIFTIEPVMIGLILAIAALLAVAIVALVPRQQTKLRIMLTFLAYWAVLTLLLVLVLQGGLGRSLLTVECIPYQAHSFGFLLYLLM